MVKLSVIVPVYNSRDFIIPCLESLVAQTMQDLEIVLVDDHGTDGSMAAAKSYLSANIGSKQFVCVSTDCNSGPGAARNLGIRTATGSYVAFVDSDDWVDARFAELLCKAAFKRDADLACCDIVMDDRSSGKHRVRRNPRLPRGEFSLHAHRHFLRRYVSYFTTFIYKRSFLLDKGIVFPPTRSSEDSAFLLCCLLSAGRTSCVRRGLYHYMIRQGSLSTSADSGKYLEKLSSMDEVLRFARRDSLYKTYRLEIEYLYIKKAVLAAAFAYVANTPRPESAKIRALYSKLLETVPHYRTNPLYRLSFRVRPLVVLMRLSPSLACKVFSIIAR